MENYIVYMHISPSNKRYIGITSTNVERRWQSGRGYKYNKHFSNAINRYGWDNFQHIIIAKGLTKEIAKWLEIELIREWDTTDKNKGYNISLGGDIPSEETKQLWSENRRGENNPFYNKNPRDHMSEDVLNKHDKKLSERWLGEKNPNYGIHKYGKDAPHYGHKHTEETKKKLGKSVICLTTKRIFYTAREGARYYDIKSFEHITSCCKGKRKSCGKFNGQKLVWKKINYKHNKVYRVSNNSTLKRVI